MTRVKICGIRDTDTAVEAARAGADFIGLMFAESRRQITPEACHDIVEALVEFRGGEGIARFDGPEPGDVRGAGWFAAWNEAIDDSFTRWRPLIVGVFADQPVEAVNDIADAAKLDLVQLSGGEDADFVRQVDLPVLHTLHVHPETTADDILDRAVPGAARAILLDTGSTAARGGTGEVFDWGIATAVCERMPAMLAGGLTPENVASAVSAASPWAVDVSSGVETNRTKDIEKVRAFIRAAKGAKS